MKRIISLGLVIVSFLITNSCKVHNVDPVYEFENGNEKSRLDYVNIIQPITYNDNSYFVDLGKTGKIEFLNEKEVYFSGDYTITSASKNVRIKAGPVPDESIVYVRQGGMDPVDITIKLLNGSSFKLGVKYDFYSAEVTEGIKGSKIAYKSTFELTLAADIVGKNLFDNTNTAKKGFGASTILSPSLTMVMSTECIEEVKDGKIISGAKTEIFTLRGKIDVGFTGQYTITRNGQTLFRKAILKHDFGSLQIPGTILQITPHLELGIAFSGEASLDIQGTLFDGYYKSTSIYENKGKGWALKDYRKEYVEESDATERDGGEISGSINGEVKVGPYITFKSQFNKYIIPTTETSVQAGFFSLTAFRYISIKGGITFNGQCEGNITLSKGIDFSFAYAVGVVDIDGETTTLFQREIPVENLSTKTPLMSASKILCDSKNFQSIYPQYTLNEFRDVLKTKSNLQFPVHGGDSFPNFDGEYEFSPAFLNVSTYSNDADTKRKLGSAVIKFENKILEIWQYNSEGRNFDYQKNVGNTENTQWILTGDREKFTLVTETTVKINNTDTYSNYVAISAKIGSDGKLLDLHYAYYRKRNIINDFENIFPEGAIRVFKDLDGVSHKR